MIKLEEKKYKLEEKYKLAIAWDIILGSSVVAGLYFTHSPWVLLALLLGVVPSKEKTIRLKTENYEVEYCGYDPEEIEEICSSLDNYLKKEEK
jgi:hypothetical protein